MNNVYVVPVWQMILMLLGATVVGAAIWDFIWTVIVGDTAAALHFRKASTKQRVLWLVVVILLVQNVVAWIV